MAGTVSPAGNRLFPRVVQGAGLYLPRHIARVRLRHAPDRFDRPTDLRHPRTAAERSEVVGPDGGCHPGSFHNCFGAQAAGTGVHREKGDQRDVAAMADCGRRTLAELCFSRWVDGAAVSAASRAVLAWCRATGRDRFADGSVCALHAQRSLWTDGRARVGVGGGGHGVDVLGRVFMGGFREGYVARWHGPGETYWLHWR